MTKIPEKITITEQISYLELEYSWLSILPQLSGWKNRREMSHHQAGQPTYPERNQVKNGPQFYFKEREPS